MRRIGLLGGSFNPAHRGHLDELWWLVSPGNPLKAKAGMAPYAARLASAREMARGTRIRVSDIEARLHTRFTVDTVTAIVRRHPADRFIWLMGADTVAEFHQWTHWRRLARTVPIAIMSRPGYERAARAARAMGWLRWFGHPAATARRWTNWSAPAISLLRLPPDPTSATRLRALDPDWHRRFTAVRAPHARLEKN
jgi:nicotinate-nucleotide adenylyltransferase